MKTELRHWITATCTAALLFTGDVLGEAPGPAAAPMTKAYVYRDYGSPDVLRLEHVAKPAPGEGQVLVRIRAASVNPLDWHYLRGTPYLLRIIEPGPFKPRDTRLGVDVAGEVEAIGGSVTRFKPGDAVFGTCRGSFAAHCLAAETRLALKPANLSFEQAAAVPVAAVTALQGLRDKGRLRPGQKVLINGASGGVGTFAVQIARSLGADVTGVCSTANVAMVRSIGADAVIDYKQQDFTRTGQRYDLILDMVGNHSLPELRRALTPAGTLVRVGSTDPGNWLGPVTGALKDAVFSALVSQHVVGLLVSINQDDLVVLQELLATGQVTPVLDRTYTLGQVPEAIRYLEQGRARGKVVITLAQDAEAAPVGADAAVRPAGPVGRILAFLALLAAALGAPVVIAHALNRRFQQRNPAKRPYRWGYYFSLVSFIAGTALGLMLEAGVAAALCCGALYAALAWFFAQRRRWAWIALTVLSFNPLVWVVNAVYLRKRWAEDPAANRGKIPPAEQGGTT
jgi:NADPH:quinone reductase-like Zn-dependent oxidoreductase